MAKEVNLGMSEIVSELLTTSLVDLPVVAAKRALGITEERTVSETAWTGYDAAIHLGSASIDRLYGSRLFGALLAQSASGFLRWQRLNNAWRGAFFAALWRATDVPTASTVEDLQEELRALAASVRAQGEQIEALVSRLTPSSDLEMARKSSVTLLLPSDPARTGNRQREIGGKNAVIGFSSLPELD